MISAVFDFDDAIKTLLMYWELSMFCNCGLIYCYSNNSEKKIHKRYATGKGTFQTNFLVY